MKKITLRDKINGVFISTLVLTNGICPFCGISLKNKGKLHTKEATDHLKKNHPIKELKKLLFWDEVEKIK
jgi:hypothetical protein